jgi:hypothetical protein
MNSTVISLIDIKQGTVMHAINIFLRVAMQGKSPQTKKWYQSRLSLLAQSLYETKLVSDVSESDLVSWREKIEGRNLSPDTLHGYIRAAQPWQDWAAFIILSSRRYRLFSHQSV